jgi:starch synthase
MKIWFVSSEVAPYSKTGGLGDVSGALPAALAALGHEVWVVSPRYRGIQAPVKLLPNRLNLHFPFGVQSVGVSVGEVSPRHHLVFLEHNAFFNRAGIYGDERGEFTDNALRFAVLSVGALSAAQLLGVAPDVVHLNDWHTGLAAPALRQGFGHTVLGKAACIFTIHNLAYQGVFPKTLMGDLGLPWSMFTPEGLEFYDQVSFMKAGLAFSDLISTVSPTYAREIQTPGYGEYLDPFLASRRDKIFGIVNGVDTDEWNPNTDSHLPARYGPDNLAGKAECKRALREQLQLSPPTTEADPPTFAVISRLARQKGIDLILDVLPELMATGAQLAVLGSGELELEERLRAAAARYPGQLGLYIGFQPRLAHRAEAGADFFLMPSRYEPCGLNQMYSLLYGTVPVVRATGGLDDTVQDLSLPEGDGFKFTDFVPEALMWAVRRALALYAKPAELEAARQRGMGHDFSWKRSAQQYIGLYETAATQRKAK